MRALGTVVSIILATFCFDSFAGDVRFSDKTDPLDGTTTKSVTLYTWTDSGSSDAWIAFMCIVEKESGNRKYLTNMRSGRNGELFNDLGIGIIKLFDSLKTEYSTDDFWQVLGEAIKFRIDDKDIRSGPVQYIWHPDVIAEMKSGSQLHIKMFSRKNGLGSSTISFNLAGFTREFEKIEVDCPATDLRIGDN